MEIRIADIEDITAIRSLAETAFLHTYKPILTPEQIDYMMNMMYSERSLRKQMTVENHTFFLCPGRGYVSFRPDGQTDEGHRRFHLEKLYVLPQWQGTGLGRILFETVCKAAKEAAGFERVRIELNVNRNNKAVTFYERMGMQKDRQGDFPIGNGFFMNDYIMAIEF